MPRSQIVTLLTDFGLRDSFVSSMKGVILGINPSANLIDISHEVQPYNIHEAAFTLKSAYRYFPPGTVHIVVVDPGVGSKRRLLLVQSRKHLFLAPDNGVLSWVLREDRRVRVSELKNESYFLKEVGPTFHGRDRLAPVAAWLSKGKAPSSFGDQVEDYCLLRLPQPIRKNSNTIQGHVICIDRFGNLITDITQTTLDIHRPDRPVSVILGNRRIRGLNSFYAKGKPGQLNALINSCGHLEIYAYKGNAKKILAARYGDSVKVSFKRE